MAGVGALAQIVVDGVSVGAIYGLVALGFVLIYKSSEVVNFALGDLLMFAAFMGWTFADPLGLPLWLSVVGAVVATALLGGFINQAFMTRILGQPQFAHILLTIGIAFALRGVVFMLWGVDQRTLDSLAPDTRWSVLGVSIHADNIQIILVTLVLVAGLFLFFRRAISGLAMRAVAENQMAAYLMSIPVRRYIAAVWMMAAAIAAMGGLLLAPLLLVDGNLWMVVIKGLIVAVIGGFHSIPGALLGGIIIGLVEQFAGVYLDSSLRELSVYGFFFVLLALFPRGILGGGFAKRV